MKIKGLIDEDFLQYKKPSMFIITCNCDFKCEKEAGVKMCQNADIVDAVTIDMDDEDIINRYISNPIGEAIVFGGLEPFLQFGELITFIEKLRNHHHIFDDVVIYTGYTRDEIRKQVDFLTIYPNIIIKFGRYKPNEKAHIDDVLGVALASSNQYAERVS